MNIKDIKGLKYPDEYFIRFFFKLLLHQSKDDKYLELGCSNGCNLMLPYQYGNEVIGVDLDNKLIEYAEDNFKGLNLKCIYKFHHKDMREFCKKQKDIYADNLILASSIYYIPKRDFISLLRDIRKNNLIKNDIPLFIRFRLPDDFRNNSDEEIEPNTVIIQNGITGEDGVLCAFYTENEMVEVLQKELNLRDFQTMKIVYDNIQNNTKVKNVDMVIWGTIN